MPAPFSGVTRPWEGYISLIKKSGDASGGLANAQQRFPIALSAVPSNPRNHGYPGVINYTSYVANRVKGKRTPSVTITAPAKPRVGAGNGWLDAALIKSLMYTGATVKDSDLWSIGLQDDYSNPAVWENARCRAFTLAQDADSGSVIATMAFISQFGDLPIDEPPSTDSQYDALGHATTHTAPSAPDAGECTNIAETSFSGLDGVRAWTLSLVRTQIHERYIDGSLWPSGIRSGPASGILTIEQTPNATTQVADSGDITIQIATNKTSGTGRFSITCKAVLDTDVLPYENAHGNLVRQYSMVDLATGGIPFAIAAY